MSDAEVKVEGGGESPYFVHPRVKEIEAKTRGMEAIENALRNAGPGEIVETTGHHEEALRLRVATPQSIQDVLAARNGVHGDFSEDARVAQGLKAVMHTGKNWDALPPVMREALEHMQTKIARILSGEFKHPDHWKDLQGYPKLVEDRL